MANTNPRAAQRQPASDPWSILKPSLVFGTYSGALGLTIGSVGGVLRSAHPVLFALFSGGQWFALGTTYWLSRSALLETWTVPGASNRNRQREASGVAGAFAGGAVAALLRGRRNILPATFMFGVFGYLGQAGYERLDAAHAERVAVEEDDRGLVEKTVTKIGRSKWSPIKLLEDGEYKQLIQDKKDRVDAEIAVIDDDLEELRRQRNEQATEEKK